MLRRELAKSGNILFPGLKFIIAGERQAVFLTFDDGPHPESTPRLLELLAKYDARATFFCLGQNVEKHPAVYDSIIAEGHAVGNHSWSHPDGWITGTPRYLADIEKASGIIRSRLFRPPYGRITPCQYRQVKRNYEIIMWTRQFDDYKENFNPAKAPLKKINPGDILVMHDSVKSSKNTLPLLKKLLPLIKVPLLSL